MSFANTYKDLKEFEEEIRLQSGGTLTEDSNKKTRVDPDGTVMEWDEHRKAWFPKIDDDFIARYQMSYGVSNDTPNAEPDPNGVRTTGSNNNSDGWSVFNSELARLREEKGEHSEEFQNMAKAGHEALQAYYNSPAYREWYEHYCKQQQQQPSSKGKQGAAPKPISTASRFDLKPSDRIRASMMVDTESADAALARAEAEQLAGVPLEDDTVDSNPENNLQAGGNEEQDSNQLNPAVTGKRKSSVPQPAWYEMTDEKNTHVYVTGLPPEIKENEFSDLMSKCGVIMNEPFTDKPRIKLYTDESGKPKGDGRCCYIKVESVDLALKIIDGMHYAPGYTLHVERAKFQPKGKFDPKRRRRLTLKEKKKLKDRQENLFRWGIDTSKFVRSKKERVLILKNAFVETDFLKDVTLIPIVRDRVKMQCAKCGVVKKVVVHDAHREGVVTVTFGTPEEADAALNFLNKALFSYPGPGGVRQLEVERWDGKTNYSVKEDSMEEASRIQQWEDFLGRDSSSDDDEEHGQVGVDGTPNIPSSSEVEENAIRDYWEMNSPNSCADTDEIGGSSGDETT